MTVAIRKIAGTDRDYPRLRQKVLRSRYLFRFFFRTTSGAPSPSTTSHLMLRLAWGQPPHLRIVEQDLSLKHRAVLELLRRSAGATQDADLQPLRSR